MARSLTGTVFQEHYDRWLYGLLIYYRDLNGGNWVQASTALGIHYTTVFKWAKDLESKGYTGLNMTRSNADAG